MAKVSSSLELEGGTKDKSIRILMYHGVSDTPRDVYSVFLNEFELQMEFLAAHCSVIPLDDAIQWFAGNAHLCRDSVVVTFDDGYENVYKNAFPILRRYDIPATIFLIGQQILKEAERPATYRNKQARYLSWEQIEELTRSGITFGSHGLSHRSIAGMGDAECLRELRLSKEILEEPLKVGVTAFSYPFGTIRDFSPRSQALVRKAGYSCALTAVSGTNDLYADPYTLRRTKIERDDGIDIFRRMMRGGLDSWIVIDKLLWCLQKPGQRGPVHRERRRIVY